MSSESRDRKSEGLNQRKKIQGIWAGNYENVFVLFIFEWITFIFITSEFFIEDDYIHLIKYFIKTQWMQKSKEYYVDVYYFSIVIESMWGRGNGKVLYNKRIYISTNTVLRNTIKCSRTVTHLPTLLL